MIRTHILYTAIPWQVGLLLPLICCFSLALKAQPETERYHSVRIFTAGEHSLHALAASGIDLDHCHTRPGAWLEAVLRDSDITRLKAQAIPFEILIPDLERYYSLRILSPAKQRALPDAAQAAHFRLGGMGGFYTLAEAWGELARMREHYPDVVQAADTIGWTYEGRPILVWTFGNAPENAPEALITCLHHAREPAGLTSVVFFLWHLLEQAQYPRSEAAWLLGNRRLYVLPVLNPDGYAYNQRRMPGGGGMWRKNRRPNGDGTFGVDLNRNYGPMESWDAANFGSSEESHSELYRGPEVFSEAETRAIRDFCLARNIGLCLNYHTFGNYLIYPFAHQSAESPDSVFFRSFACAATEHGDYAAGRDVEVLRYTVRGASDDWMYLEPQLNRPIYAMTMELGTQEDGFWPEPDRIFDLALDNLPVAMAALRSVGANVQPVQVYPDYSGGDGKVRMVLEWRNIGRSASASGASVEVRFPDPRITPETPLRLMPSLPPAAEYRDTFALGWASELPAGWVSTLEILYRSGELLRRDTFQLQTGAADISVLSTKGMEGWRSETWGLINDPLSGDSALCDSPNGEYPNNRRSELLYGSVLDLRGCGRASLALKVRWNIEARFDIAMVEVSSDAGASWHNLSGSRMRPSDSRAGRRNPAVYGFDGNVHYWQYQECSLDRFCGEQLLLRFVMLSDSYGSADGIFLRDITLRRYALEESRPAGGIEFRLAPNPILRRGVLALILSPNIDTRHARVQISNTLGQIVYEQSLRDMPLRNDRVEINTAAFAPGRYAVQMRGPQGAHSAFLVIMR